MVSNCDALTL